MPSKLARKDKDFLMPRSSEEVFDHLRGIDAGEPLVETLKLVSELVVIDAEGVQDRGVQVTDMDRIFSNIETQLIGFAVNLPTFDAATGHPHTEATRVVITTVVGIG